MNKAGGIMLPDLKQTHRSMEKNREPRDELHLYGQSIYYKVGKNIQWGKNSFFNIWHWEN